MKLLLVVNPVSGGTDKTEAIAQIQAFCAEKNLNLDLLMLTGKDDLTLIRNHARQHQPDCLVAMGGDGTIKLAATIALEAGLPVGILPSGSANGMARELDLPTTLIEALKVIAQGYETTIDVLTVNGEICLHLSDIGLNAQLIKYYQQNNWRGMFGYARGVVRVLLNRRVLHVTIRTPHQTFHRQAQMVALANARMYGTGAMINPDGDLTDGRFEVVLLRQFSWTEFLKMFWRFRPYDPTKTEILTAESIHIETKRKAYFQVDGEYRGRVKTINASVRPGALRVMMPLAQTPSEM
jgi:diacylglycerol kinase (ATP)